MHTVYNSGRRLQMMRSFRDENISQIISQSECIDWNICFDSWVDVVAVVVVDDVIVLSEMRIDEKKAQKVFCGIIEQSKVKTTESYKI